MENPPSSPVAVCVSVPNQKTEANVTGSFISSTTRPVSLEFSCAPTPIGRRSKRGRKKKNLLIYFLFIKIDFVGGDHLHNCNDNMVVSVLEKLHVAFDRFLDSLFERVEI